MNRKIIMLTFILLVTHFAFCQKIFDTEADKHIGETLSVSGKVNGFKVSKKLKATLLFCGASYPQKYFTVIVNDTNKPAGHPRLTDWNIAVTGLITRYKGMPAIKVPNWAAVQSVLFADHVPNDL